MFWSCEYLSKPPASVGWQENCFREPQNTYVFEDRRKRFDAPDDEDQGFERYPPAGRAVKTGKNHNKPHHIQGRKDYYDALAKEITLDDMRAERDTAT